MAMSSTVQHIFNIFKSYNTNNVHPSVSISYNIRWERGGGVTMYSKDFYDDDDDNVSVSSFTSGSDEGLDTEQEDANRRTHGDTPPFPMVFYDMKTLHIELIPLRCVVRYKNIGVVCFKDIRCST